ncbi:Ribosome hibernation promotion factor [bioreactor metagenome]|uniref:Ribosome hibernation promotion factor n=1 Tax=bioreactor metagenome TaxID=1076179 RepID=A0A645HL18_9ZZZZ
MPEEKEFDIIRKKHFAIKPMMPEEAILQMNLLDHTFFVFRDSESNALSIVYQRKNGGYGLIETDDVQ